MEFNLIKFLPSNWLHAFGATLFHSLWLGILLSLSVAVIMFSTRKVAASLRYNLLTGSLLLFVLGTAVIFYKSLEVQPAATTANVIVVNAINNTDISPSATALQSRMLSGVNNLLNIWNAYVAQIVLVWFLIICAKSIQLFVGLNGVYHLRSKKVYAAGNRWDEKISQLAKKMGLKQTVGLFQSGIAQVPMAVGYFKPLVLVPLGLLNGLSDSEVEAILCHELAHIKRRDYLVNLLQSLIEIVFFFNPAVLWVSKLIRNERENCCDDLAVQHMDDKRNYVKALITCQEFQLNAPRFAMAVTGKKNHLFQRISRMLFDTKTTLNKMEKTILTIALVSVVICSAAFKNVAESNKKQNTYAPLTAYEQTFQDSIKKKTAIQKAKLDSNAAKKASKENKLSMEQEISLRQELEAAAINAEIDAKAEEKRYKLEQNRYEAAEKRRKVDELRYNAEQKRYDAEQKRYDIEAKKYKLESEKYQIEAKRYADKNPNYIADPSAPPLPPTPNIPPSPANNISTPIRPVIPITTGSMELLTPSNGALPANQAFAFVPKTKSQSISRSWSLQSNIQDSHIPTDAVAMLKEMVNDGIIESAENVSFKMNYYSLTVNGVKQSNSVHQKYKNKYLPGKNTTIMTYSSSTKKN